MGRLRSAQSGSSSRSRKAHADLRGARIAEVLRRSQGADQPNLPTPEESHRLTRRKVEPMVRGLFPKVEQDTVLACVERSVVFVSPSNIVALIERVPFHGTAWDLANLYLASVGADLLGPDATAILGLSQEASCYVSSESLVGDEPFEDFIVHEVAHIFHNCKRQTLGLPVTRRREWLLDIDFRKRETFAWSCEAFARVVEGGGPPTERVARAQIFAERFCCSDRRVHAAEVVDIVQEAAGARNGWRVILKRCAPGSPRMEIP
jgi:hypothetical protein